VQIDAGFLRYAGQILEQDHLSIRPLLIEQPLGYDLLLESAVWPAM